MDPRSEIAVLSIANHGDFSVRTTRKEEMISLGERFVEYRDVEADIRDLLRLLTGADAPVHVRLRSSLSPWPDLSPDSESDQLCASRKEFEL